MREVSEGGAGNSSGARVWSRAFSSLVFAALFALACAGEARACDCMAGGAPCEEYWRAGAVFAGTVVGSAKATVPRGGYRDEMRVVRLAVAEIFRGVEPAAEIEVVTGRGGGDCGYGFREGQSYLVYARRDEENGRLYASICSRTRRLAEASADLAYIRGLGGAAAAGAVLSGSVRRRSYDPKDGEEPFKPVASAAVVIEGPSGLVEGRTDERGEYRFANLAPGRYRVKLRVPEGLTAHAVAPGALAERATELAESGCAEVNFHLEPDTSVAGRVVDAAGDPVAGVRVQMRGVPGGAGAHAHLSEETDGEGHFEFRTLQPGGYLLGLRVFNAPEPKVAPYPRTLYPGVLTEGEAKIITVKEGERVRGLELRLPPRLAARAVEGVVVWSDGRAAAGAHVFVSILEGGATAAFTTVVADAAGRFSLAAHEGPVYRLKPHARQTAGGEVWGDESELPPAGPAHVRLVLPAPKK